MIGEPQKRISERALTVWKITGIIYVFLSILIGIGASIAIFFFHYPLWIIFIIIVGIIIIGYFLTFIIPKLRWQRWRYEVREQEIELQRGILIKKRTLIPMIRVQHVDTIQGPLLKKYRLSTISISTAATTHEIPALDENEADELRISIAKLARVAEEDV